MPGAPAGEALARARSVPASTSAPATHARRSADEVVDRLPGPLVAVVGCDGAGKSTLVRALAARLERGGVRARVLDRFDLVRNRGVPAARLLVPDVELIKRCTTDMPPRARFLFLVWFAAMTIGSVPRDDDGRPRVLVSDGYWMKHAASEIAYGLDPAWVLAVVAGLPPPDLVVYLRPPLDEAWRRKARTALPYECGLEPAPSPAGFAAHQARVVAVLDGWAARDGWLVVEDVVEPDELAGRLAPRVVDATTLRAYV